jgi:hypothetical protein
MDTPSYLSLEGYRSSCFFMQEAIDMLLDPLVSMDDLKPWQHQCIIRAFLYQGQHQMALKYINVQQPPLKDIEDIRLV